MKIFHLIWTEEIQVNYFSYLSLYRPEDGSVMRGEGLSQKKLVNTGMMESVDESTTGIARGCPPGWWGWGCGGWGWWGWGWKWWWRDKEEEPVTDPPPPPPPLFGGDGGGVCRTAAWWLVSMRLLEFEEGWSKPEPRPPAPAESRLEVVCSWLELIRDGLGVENGLVLLPPGDPIPVDGVSGLRPISEEVDPWPPPLPPGTSLPLPHPPTDPCCESCSLLLFLRNLALAFWNQT